MWRYLAQRWLPAVKQPWWVARRPPLFLRKLLVKRSLRRLAASDKMKKRNKKQKSYWALIADAARVQTQQAEVALFSFWLYFNSAGRCMFRLSAHFSFQPVEIENGGNELQLGLVVSWLNLFIFWHLSAVFLCALVKWKSDEYNKSCCFCRKLSWVVWGLISPVFIQLKVQCLFFLEASYLGNWQCYCQSLKNENASS